MKHFLLSFLLFAGVSSSLAQSSRFPAFFAAADNASNIAVAAGVASLPDLADSAHVKNAPPSLPVTPSPLAPELAIEAYQRRSAEQVGALAGYSSIVLIHSELPATAQSGELEVERHYSAPRDLVFKTIRFSGDRFVKTNVIARVLQSEVDHVRKDDASLNAISPANYKFSYRGTTVLDGRQVHVYQVKPHKKRAGMFKGRIYLDAYAGSLVRIEGTPVKSPSFFIRKIEFVQDYADVGPFTFPVHLHSEAQARIIGQTLVDIYYRDYQPVRSTVQSAERMPSM